MRRFAGLALGKQLRHELDLELASSQPAPQRLSACAAVLRQDEATPGSKGYGALSQGQAAALLELCVSSVCEAPAQLAAGQSTETDVMLKVSFRNGCPNLP